MTTEETKTIINKFLQEWTQQDYNLNSRELFEIGVEYKKCEELANSDLSWQELDDKGRRKYPRKFATEYFQIRNGGMTDDLRVKSNFEINNAKLDKYFKWVEFNKTSYEKEDDKKLHQERFNIIKDMLINLKSRF